MFRYLTNFTWRKRFRLSLHGCFHASCSGSSHKPRNTAKRASRVKCPHQTAGAMCGAPGWDPPIVAFSMSLRNPSSPRRKLEEPLEINPHKKSFLLHTIKKSRFSFLGSLCQLGMVLYKTVLSLLQPQVPGLLLCFSSSSLGWFFFQSLYAALKRFFQFPELCYFLAVQTLSVEKSMELWVEDGKLWEV